MGVPGHEVVAFGPVTRGDPDPYGRPYEASGLGWWCRCGQYGVGHTSAEGALANGQLHLEREARWHR